jgi:hypothetical protein
LSLTGLGIPTIILYSTRFQPSLFRVREQLAVVGSPVTVRSRSHCSPAPPCGGTGLRRCPARLQPGAYTNAPVTRCCCPARQPTGPKSRHTIGYLEALRRRELEAAAWRWAVRTSAGRRQSEGQTTAGCNGRGGNLGGGCVGGSRWRKTTEASPRRHCEHWELTVVTLPYWYSIVPRHHGWDSGAAASTGGRQRRVSDGFSGSRSRVPTATKAGDA